MLNVLFNIMVLGVCCGFVVIVLFGMDLNCLFLIVLIKCGWSCFGICGTIFSSTYLVILFLVMFGIFIDVGMLIKYCILVEEIG